MSLKILIGLKYQHTSNNGSDHIIDILFLIESSFCLADNGVWTMLAKSLARC